MAAYEKAKKEILFLMHTIDEWAKDRTLEVGQKNNYCGLLESYVQNYTKTLEYAGEMDAAKQQRYAEIRELNQENRELRRHWSVEDVRQMKEQRDKAAHLLNQILQEDGNRRYLYHAERTIITNFLNSLNESK